MRGFVRHLMTLVVAILIFHSTFVAQNHKARRTSGHFALTVGC